MDAPLQRGKPAEHRVTRRMLPSTKLESSPLEVSKHEMLR
jgi:hypothetical protein